MIHLVVVWLAVAAFAGAGLVNVIGVAGAKDNFARSGYPGWWNYVTGGLEIAVAVLVAIPGGRIAGVILGAAIVAAAVLTVLRYREFSHLAPLGVFAVLLAISAVAV